MGSKATLMLREKSPCPCLEYNPEPLAFYRVIAAPQDFGNVYNSRAGWDYI